MPKPNITMLAAGSGLLALVFGGAACGSHGTSSRDTNPAKVRLGSATSIVALNDPVTSGPTAPPAPTTLPPILAPQPGTAKVIGSAASPDGVALAFDDGFCDKCVGNLVSAVERTGAHVTFCPNGAYGGVWSHYAERIKVLIAKGQVSICNHTFSHKKLTTLSTTAIRDELQRNEDWIEQTFGISSRPYFRPPGGSYNGQVLAVAGELGFTQVVNWSITLSDSSLQPQSHITDVIRRCSQPGAIVLGHANYAPTGEVFDQLIQILTSKHLRTVTVHELLARDVRGDPPPSAGACA